MNYPIPPGTRDILPDEMRELRALSTALLGTFERFGYGEVWTPTMEYEDVLVQGDERAAGRQLPALRRARAGAGAALRHDDPDRAARRDPLRRRRRPAAPLLPVATPTAR